MVVKRGILFLNPDFSSASLYVSRERPCMAHSSSSEIQNISLEVKCCFFMEYYIIMLCSLLYWKYIILLQLQNYYMFLLWVYFYPIMSIYLYIYA